jgi:diguanylate cyclase (GGDEF)-like protein/PAS domain S-box-containing protein
MKPSGWAWVRASLQGTTFLGLTMIALVWGSIVYHLGAQKNAAIQAAFQETANLARSFEEQIVRTVRGIDATLLVLRAVYGREPNNFDLAEWTWESGIVSDAVTQYSTIDASGRLKASSLGPVPNVDLSDSDHFNTHIESETDEVFISKPVMGRMSERPSIQLSRRILRPDGLFDGVIVASLDPGGLARFYETIDIGRDGSISVVGKDGYVRASRGFKKPILYLDDKTGLRRAWTAAPHGSYQTTGGFDGVARVLSYRTVVGLPLVVAVGLSEREVLAAYDAAWFKYVGVGAGVTGLILLVMLLSIQHQRKLYRTNQALRESEALALDRKTELNTTLENIDQGIIMADVQGVIHVINRRTIELLDLSEEWLTGHHTLQEMLAFMRERGEFDNNHFEPRVRNMLMGDGLDTGVSKFERTRPNGTVLEVRLSPTPDGGHVRTLTDITERKRNEARIAKLASHDSLTNVANRALFCERVSQALGRTQREADCFAVLYLDLDHFKDVNDTLGHAAGDYVLEETARRLTACIRDGDTVARFGGDEFAILQANATDEESASNLARRIIAEITGSYHFEGHAIEIGTSIGIAIAPRDGADLTALMRNADLALYQAKNSGRNRFCFVRNGKPFVSRLQDMARAAQAS